MTSPSAVLLSWLALAVKDISWRQRKRFRLQGVWVLIPASRCFVYHPVDVCSYSAQPGNFAERALIPRQKDVKANSLLAVAIITMNNDKLAKSQK
jgi:hypothetical protein